KPLLVSLCVLASLSPVVAGDSLQGSSKLSAAQAFPAEAGVECTAGWVKYPGNPVLGGKYGTCFDVSVLKDNSGYRMWVSWRPEKSIALVTSKDGTHWSEPLRIILGPRKETGWEDDINRP